MRNLKTEIIDAKAFAVLILDYEWLNDEILPDYVSCRVLVDGWYKGSVTAESRTEAIRKFRAGEWEA